MAFKYCNKIHKLHYFLTLIFPQNYAPWVRWCLTITENCELYNNLRVGSLMMRALHYTKWPPTRPVNLNLYKLLVLIFGFSIYFCSKNISRKLCLDSLREISILCTLYCHKHSSQPVRFADSFAMWCIVFINCYPLFSKLVGIHRNVSL